MKTMRVALIGIALALLTGCGVPFVEVYEVPPASKAKLLTANGYQEGFLEPGRHVVWHGFVKPDSVLLSTAVFTRSEPMNMILSDKLTLSFNVNTRMALDRNPENLNGVFDALSPVNGEINLGNIYQTYAQMAIQQQARRVLSQYTVEEVQANYPRLSGEMRLAIVEALAGTPIEVQDVALAAIQYPEVVTRAVEIAKQRELEIAETEAQAQKDMVAAQKELELANAQREIELVRARTERDANRIIGEGITPEFLALRQIEAQIRMAENDAATFMPYEAVNTLGAQIRMFQSQE